VTYYSRVSVLPYIWLSQTYLVSAFKLADLSEIFTIINEYGVVLKDVEEGELRGPGLIWCQATVHIEFRG
jgi:hypothetical protein